MIKTKVPIYAPPVVAARRAVVAMNLGLGAWRPGREVRARRQTRQGERQRFCLGLVPLRDKDPVSGECRCAVRGVTVSGSSYFALTVSRRRRPNIGKATRRYAHVSKTSLTV